MIPVYQTRMTPEEGGDCHAACIASVLEVPLDTVPRLNGPEGLTHEGFAAYRARLDAWLAARNLALVHWTVAPERARDWVPQGYSLVAVEAPGFPGFEHSLVAHDGEIVHNPTPGAGLAHPWRIVGWDIFQALDPAVTVEII